MASRFATIALAISVSTLCSILYLYHKKRGKDRLSSPPPSPSPSVDLSSSPPSRPIKPLTRKIAPCHSPTPDLTDQLPTTVTPAITEAASCCSQPFNLIPSLSTPVPYNPVVTEPFTSPTCSEGDGDVVDHHSIGGGALTTSSPVSAAVTATTIATIITANTAHPPTSPPLPPAITSGAAPSTSPLSPATAAAASTSVTNSPGVDIFSTSSSSPFSSTSTPFPSPSSSFSSSTSDSAIDMKVDPLNGSPLDLTPKPLSSPPISSTNHNHNLNQKSKMMDAATSDDEGCHVKLVTDSTVSTVLNLKSPKKESATKPVMSNDQDDDEDEDKDIRNEVTVSTQMDTSSPHKGEGDVASSPPSPSSHGEGPDADNDANSDRSSDSGQGGSQSHSPNPLMAPTPMSPMATGHTVTPTPLSSSSSFSIVPSTDDHIVYQFYLPTPYCGKLIGFQGKSIISINQKCGTNNIMVNACDYTDSSPNSVNIVAILGSREAVAKSIRMIRNEIFPPNEFPNVTLQQINAIVPDDLPMALQYGVQSDVMVSSVVSAGHLFLHQPLNVTFPSLTSLTVMMTENYTYDMTAPGVPDPNVGVIVAAPTMGGWYRAIILRIDGDYCDVKFMDFGGFTRLLSSDLRQIRIDFMSLPFQACECILSGIAPIDGNRYSLEAKHFVESLVHHQPLKVEVVCYTMDNIPIVNLYYVRNGMTGTINDDLVNEGHATRIFPLPPLMQDIMTEQTMETSNKQNKNRKK